MKKVSLNLFVTLLTAIMIISCTVIPAYAADTGVIIISKRVVGTGEDITITIKYNSDDTLKTVNGYLSFNNQFFKYKSGGSSVEKDRIRINETVIDSNKIRTYQIVFTAVAPGSGSFSFSLEGLKSSGTRNTVSQGSSVTVTGAKIEDTSTKNRDDKLKVSFDEATYYIINDINTIPELPNFARSITKYNGQDINTLTDNMGKYIIFYLSNEDGSKTHWFYLSEDKKLEPLEYLISDNNIYIVETPDTESTVPEGDWKAGKFTIPSTLVTVDCYESTKSIMSDFYIFLCYFDGVSQYYRYDKKTEVLQRDPGFTLTTITPIETTAPQKISFVGYLANLPHEAKSLIFLSALETTLIVVLIVLLIKKRKNIIM